MQIFVNEQELDAEMADEKTVAEVYEAVSRWSADNNKYILNLKVDAREVSLARLKEVATDAVRRLDFYIGDEMDMVLSTLSETDRYIEQIGSTLFEREALDHGDRANLIEGVHWMTQIMNSVSSILHLDLSGVFSPMASDERRPDESVQANMERLTAIAEAFSGEESQVVRDDIARFLNELRNVKLFVMALMMQLETMSAGREELLEMLEDFETRIPSLAQELVGINESLNSGRDSEAMGALESSTDALNRYIAALFALDHQLIRNEEQGLMSTEIDGVSFNTRADSLTSLLKDLSSALEETDITAVGDILEYELSEQLKDLRPYLTVIRERLLQKTA